MALWRPEVVPDAVIVVAAPSGFIDVRAFDEIALPSVVAGEWAEDGRHVVIGDPEGEHRLWLADEASGQRLAVLIPLDGDFQLRVDGVLRFYRRLHGDRSGPRSRRLDLTPLQRSRLVLMLRAIDGRLDGASYREIAAALLDPDVIHLPARDWKGSAAHSRVFRLVKDAWAFIHGGYRKLLDGDWP